MRKRLFLFTLVHLPVLLVFAQQNDPVVFTIEGKPVYKSEVERAYKKGDVVAEEKVPIRDFVTSYIQFRLNVEEAKKQGIDTTATYVNAFGLYRSQMAAPYLKDTVYEAKYIEKIYKRQLENVEVNHAIVPFNKEAVFPSDTLITYRKAILLRDKILKNGFNGVDFGTDKSNLSMIGSHGDRNGYIGWIIPFALPAKVEDAVYSLPINEISQPIRTPKGYHIVQVLNKRPAVGSVEIEQVLFNFPHIPPKQHHIDSVGKVAMREYDKLHSAKDFDALCQKFSKVYQTGEKGCYFGIVDLDSKLPIDFVNAAFNLKSQGDVSKPVMSNYGYHIIRLIKKMPVAPFDEKAKQQLKNRITQSDKTQELSDERKQSLMNQFHVKVNNEAYTELSKIAETLSPQDSAFLSSVKNEDDILLDIDGKKKYKVKDLMQYIQIRRHLAKVNTDEIQIYQISEAMPYTLSSDILKEYYDLFVTTLLSNYAENTLEERNPQFRDIVNDFSNELLVSELLDKNIWQRSVDDKSGLSAFFKENKEKYTFKEAKYKGLVIHAKDKESLRKAESIVKKEKQLSRASSRLRETLNKDSITVKVEQGLWSKGENPFVDCKVFEGAAPAVDNDYPYFFVSGKFIDSPEDYTDVKNEVEFDYQAKLENDWRTYLKNKYKVGIDESVLSNWKQ